LYGGSDKVAATLIIVVVFPTPPLLLYEATHNALSSCEIYFWIRAIFSSIFVALRLII
jgi:hypothetical protein